MTKTLTEQWREGTLPNGKYYIKLEPNFTERYDVGYSEGGDFVLYNIEDIEEVLAPVPSYRQLYGPNDGNIPVGLFTVLKLIKRDIEQYQKIRHLTDLECGIKSQVVSLLKRHLGKDEPVSKTEQLEKKLEIATKALRYYAQCKHINLDLVTIRDDCAEFEAFEDGEHARKALKEMEGVK